MKLCDVLQVKNALIKYVYYVKNYKFCNPSAIIFSLQLKE